MSKPALKQTMTILGILDDSSCSNEQLETLFKTGLLEDLFESTALGKITVVDRNLFRAMLGLESSIIWPTNLPEEISLEDLAKKEYFAAFSNNIKKLTKGSVKFRDIPLNIVETYDSYEAHTESFMLQGLKGCMELTGGALINTAKPQLPSFMDIFGTLVGTIMGFEESEHKVVPAFLSVPETLCFCVAENKIWVLSCKRKGKKWSFTCAEVMLIPTHKGATFIFTNPVQIKRS